MRILFLTRSFNSLTQRLYVALTERGHEVSIEYDIADSVSEEAVEAFAPDLIVAPFLKRALPESIWRNHVCLIVHPGIVGDRGPSALDWAIMNGEREWGVTVLQAIAELDAGPIWASATFPMRGARKSGLYRNEVTDAAEQAVLLAVERFATGTFRPVPLRQAQGRGHARPLMTQEVRRIDWACDKIEVILRKIRAADGTPGVQDKLFGAPCCLYDAYAERLSEAAAPGTIVARRDGAVLRAAVDGGVWIGHAKRVDDALAYKLPVALVFPAEVRALPASQVALDAPFDGTGYREIRYEEDGEVGYLHFPFYNGAMSTAQCKRLLAAYSFALARPTRVLVLMGGPDFWSNGIHLNVIEAAESPADESWRNINAIDDVTCAILETADRVTVAAMQGNGGAGGVFMALAADHVWTRRGVILNPHYKNMGNLYGSEYWTYLLPRRVKHGPPQAVMEQRLPLSGRAARELGLVDAVFGDDHADFVAAVRARAGALAVSPEIEGFIQRKRAARARDEIAKPLAAYRADELAQMRCNFYGFDPSYHVARSHFVHKTPPSWTPRHLAVHRDRVQPRRRAAWA
jgi:putative two-component system protein, hydrogenase maturation factor HypX/HoxX